MIKNAKAQNLLDNANLFTYKALVKYCTKTVVVHTHALLYCLGKITNLQFLCGKTWFSKNKLKTMNVQLILSAFETEKKIEIIKMPFLVKTKPKIDISFDSKNA